MIASLNATTVLNSKQYSALYAPATAASREIGRDIGINAELGNFSIIIYGVPSLRARVFLPNYFETEDLVLDGQTMSLVSVISYLDLGSSRNGQDAFEQTTYRLHARYGGKSVHWLLGASIGSLSAIALRQLWPMPCHLGAMEFQVMFGKNENRYLYHRLYTQSQWINASWEINDTSKPLNGSWNPPLLRAVNVKLINDYFMRRDGSIGLRQIRMSNLDLTQGNLISARCDLMEKLGLVTAEEMARPMLVALQRNLLCRFDAPRSLSVDQTMKESMGGGAKPALMVSPIT